MSDQAQVVIVTGASRGLGAAAARILAELGAQVVITARSAVPLDELADNIRAGGGRVLAVAGDISDPGTSKRLVNAALDEFGRLDVLVNNAAIIGPVARLDNAEAEPWRRTLNVNVLGPLLLVQAALPHLRENEGRVINVSSGAAIKAITGWGAYCVSKAALNHLNNMLAHEEPDVTAIALRPGVVDTAMQTTIRERGDEAMTDEEHARFVAYYDQGELLPPEKPGRALALLALYAPHDWSGEFVRWDEDRVTALDPDVR